MKANTRPAIATDNLDRALEDLDEVGYCVIRDALPPATLKTVRAHMDEMSAQFDASKGSIQSGGMLINHGPEFVSMIEHPALMVLLEHLLGPDFLLSSFGAKIAHPRTDDDGAGVVSGLHHDQGYVPLPMPPYALAAAQMWFISDFTEANGATYVSPGSCKLGRWPDSGEDPELVQLTGPAGSFGLWDSRTWHATGFNRSDQPRIGILGYYCRAFVRQQMNQTASAIDPKVLADASPRLKTLLGYKPYLTLGMIAPKPGEPGNFFEASARPPAGSIAFDCPCGKRSVARSDEDLVAAVRAHINEAHSEYATIGDEELKGYVIAGAVRP